MTGMRTVGRLSFRRTLQVAVLLLLCCTAGLYWSQAPRSSMGFEVRLTPQELQSLLQTLDAVARVLTKASIPFFMVDGTLLGSWRHHGIIPWDDDVDLGLLFYYRKGVYKALTTLQPHFVLNTDHPKRWKVYPANATPIDWVTWKFPFVDFNFYHFNDTHIWDSDTENYAGSIYFLSEVLPLRLRPFHDRQLPAPKDTKTVLEKTYGDLRNCRSTSFNHQKETGDHRMENRPCWTMASVMPFVERRVLEEGGCNESLQLRGEVLGWQAFPSVAC